MFERCSVSFTDLTFLNAFHKKAQGSSYILILKKGEKLVALGLVIRKLVTISIRDADLFSLYFEETSENNIA